jgi:hypothetical protein
VSGGNSAANADADANSRPVLRGLQPPPKYAALKLGSYGTDLPFPGLDFALASALGVLGADEGQQQQGRK